MGVAGPGALGDDEEEEERVSGLGAYAGSRVAKDASSLAVPNNGSPELVKSSSNHSVSFCMLLRVRKASEERSSPCSGRLKKKLEDIRGQLRML